MKKILGYFKGGGKEVRRVKWPKWDAFMPAIVTVLCIAAFAAIFLVIEDYAGGIIIKTLRDAFESLRS